MSVQDVVDQAGRLIENLQDQARDFFAGNSDTEEPKTSDLWKKTSSSLEKALAIYNRKESPETPESTLLPWGETKSNCQREIDEILDAVLVVLGTCGAAGYRSRIRQLQAHNVASETRIANYREQMASAADEKSQNFIEGLLGSNKESLRDRIADETERIAERKRQIEDLKVGFREHLKQIGISVPPDIADSFLLQVEDDIVSMAAVISNIGRITEQLQNLVDHSKEASEQTKRYYGIYVLLVFAVDRIQTHFIKEIDETFLPRLWGFEKEAAQNVANAKTLLARGEHKDQLRANINAGQRTIDACRLMADTLRAHKQAVLAENQKVRNLARVAVNTYRTVRVGSDVAELIGHCEAAFQALRDLRLPTLRPFENIQLNEELQKLAERVAAKD